MHTYIKDTGSDACTVKYMLGDITVAENIYIACDYTGMRKFVDGLAAIVHQQLRLDPFSNALFLFCGRHRNCMKELFWKGDGFILLYKRLENVFFKWLCSEAELKPISWQQFHWFMEGLQVEEKQSIKPAQKGTSF